MHDRYKLISGCGNSTHARHPKLTRYEANPMPSTVPEAEKQLQNDLCAAASPVNVRQRFMSTRTSLLFSKHAIKKIAESYYSFGDKNESKMGRVTTEQQSMKLLRYDEDVKFTALFHNDSK